MTFHFPLMPDLFICLWSDPFGLKRQWWAFDQIEPQISSSTSLNLYSIITQQNRIKLGSKQALACIMHWLHFIGLHALSWAGRFSMSPSVPRGKQFHFSCPRNCILYSDLLGVEGWQNSLRDMDFTSITLSLAKVVPMGQHSRRVFHRPVALQEF